MPFLPSLPDPAHLSDLYARFPDNVQPLMVYTDGLLRGEGELNVGERELIATYVSALNACTFCAGAHRAYAEVFGIDAGLIDALIAWPSSIPCRAGSNRTTRRRSMMLAGPRPRSTRRCRSARSST